MMSIPSEQADKLSLWKYEALLWNWNEAHDIGDVEPPDPDVVLPLLERINADPRLTH
jgi:hypothetical protein